MQFGTIPEHHVLKQNLIHAAASGKVAHAQLFIGSIGSAHLALALAFATYLNCTAPTTADSCGTCCSCSSMVQCTHPDVHFVFPGKRSSSEAENQMETINLFRTCLKNNPFLTLEEWTQALHSDSKQCQITRGEVARIIQSIGLKTFVGRYKIVLIWLPEYMNISAANALLKTLEEPPACTIFLLVGMDRDKILPTIASRTQQRIVPSFSDQAIQQLLQCNHPDLSPTKVGAIAFLAEGNIAKAYALLEEALTDSFECFSAWMRNCYSSNFIQVIAQSEAFHATPTDAQKRFFSYGLQFIRVTLLSVYTPDILQTLSKTEALFSQKFGQTVTVAQLRAMVPLFTQAYACLERNANAKMVYTHTSIQLAKLFKSC